MENAWAQIDVQLKRRIDLIPNLVDTVKGYAAHEKETLDAVIEARNSAIAAPDTPAGQAGADQQLTGALRQLFALSEAYPDLKANQNFLALQEELTATEGRVAYARQFYNDTVLGYNNKLDTFPTLIFARLMKFVRREYFEADAVGTRGPEGPVLTMYELIAANKRRSIAPDRGFRRSLLARSARPSACSIGYGIAGTLIALVLAGAMAFASYWKADAIALAVSRARPADPEQYKRLHNLVEGLCIAGGIPKPRVYVDRRPGAERVRHRAQPSARGDRRHHRAARDDEPGRTRRGRRPRAVATSGTTTSWCRPSRSPSSAPSRSCPTSPSA